MASPTTRLFATSFFLTLLAGAAPMVVFEGGQALWAVLSHPWQGPAQTPAWQFHLERTRTAAIAVGLSAGVLAIARPPQARQVRRVSQRASRQLPWRTLWPGLVGLSFGVGFWSLTDRQALQQSLRLSQWQPALNQAGIQLSHGHSALKQFGGQAVQQAAPLATEVQAEVQQWLGETQQQVGKTSEQAWQRVSQQAKAQWQAWNRER
jgi:hypothetical protein